ncbi:membrane protein [Bacillus coahuilensis m2-6]|uniref:Membrane protein n=1 Tax=Bacillus coahuilensis p1.1.43 TaxID=1150625 RepID=A0A147K717_9BACI|nr:DUF1294 domain-containing protein [Bacillus coahuilensis]KUP05772.1 membrane protein [Bacillus coahuilensis p1.1.43]KUP06632.1 membrane protein [Bacillus coahuilensis m2-6]
MYIALSIILIVNLVSYSLMGVDKKRAQQGQYRISEKTLWTWTICGGALGSFLGMNAFRHKTKHTHFKIGVPVILLLQVVGFLFFVQ